VNRDDGVPALTVTVVSLGIGSGALLAVAVVHDGIPRLTLASWLVVWWLAVINTALAFTVWNYTMRRLSAMESSLINNTMLVHVAVLAWIFLASGPTRGPCSAWSWWAAESSWSNAVGSATVRPLRRRAIRVEPFLQGAGADATDPELPARVRSLQVLRGLELLAGEASLAPEVGRIVADRLRATLR
jgi:hypothetical protein